MPNIREIVNPPVEAGTDDKMVTTEYNSQVARWFIFVVDWLRETTKALNTQINTNTADISTNTTDIATNTADIATNTADILLNEDPNNRCRVYKATGGTNQVITPGVYTTLNYDTAYYDVGSNFNLTTDRFLVPKTGVWEFKLSFMKNASVYNQTTIVRIYINSAVTLVQHYLRSVGSSLESCHFTIVHKCNEGDTIYTAAWHAAAGCQVQRGLQNTTFSATWQQRSVGY